jgi:hypothetical protein
MFIGMGIGIPFKRNIFPSSSEVANLLLEDGSNMLLEDGFLLLLE